MAAAQATMILGDADFPAEWGDTVPNEAFLGRCDLKKVEIPPWIKKIGIGAFEGCTNLEECVVPPGVEVGWSAFFECFKIRIGTVLGDADFPAAWGDTVPNQAFQNRLDVMKVELPDGIKKIGGYAFSGCANLDECVVPPGVEVDKGAFISCKKIRIGTVLGDADFPAAWGDTIPDKAFRERLDVVKVEIPPRIKKIDNNAFEGCRNLVECILPETIGSIGNEVFLNCINLQSCNVPDEAKLYCGWYVFTNCGSLIPTTVLEPVDFDRIHMWKGIPNKALAGRLDIKEVCFHNRITVIGIGAFLKCYNLKKVILPANIQMIDKHAFSDCINLETIIFPELSHKCRIRFRAFSGCDKLPPLPLPPCFSPHSEGSYYLEDGMIRRRGEKDDPTAP